MNVNVDEIRAAMAEEYETAKTAVMQKNPKLLPGEVASALEAKGWRHFDGSIGASLYGFHPPAQTGGYRDAMVHTNCVAIQYAMGSPQCHGMVIVKNH